MATQDRGVNPLDAAQSSFTAPMLNLLAWACDPVLLTNSYGVGTGIVYYIRVPWPKSATINNVVTIVATAGSGLTNCFAGVWSSTGALLTRTADQSSNWQSSGVKTMPVLAPTQVPGGPGNTLIVGALVGSGSTTACAFTRSAGGFASAMTNYGMTASTLRSGQCASGQTSLPDPLPISSSQSDQYLKFFALA